MSIPLTNRTWTRVEARYPTWREPEGARWYTLEHGYVYVLPDIRWAEAQCGFVGERFLLTVWVEESVWFEEGDRTVPTGEPFSGRVTASFLGTDYPMAYDRAADRFIAVLPCPTLAVWTPEGYLFSGTVTAENHRGGMTAAFQVEIYRPLPSIVSLQAPDCAVSGVCRVEAEIVLTTLPPGREFAFSGQAKAAFQGGEYLLTKNGKTGRWEGAWTAPAATSWPLEGHVYPGAVTALSGQDQDRAAFGVRVREGTPPSVRAVRPAQDLFLCGLCSPLFLWQAADGESGLAGAWAALDGQEPEPAVLRPDGEIFWQPPRVHGGAHTVTLSVTDNDGNTAQLSRTLTALALVTDRTAADAERRNALAALGWNAMNAAQRTGWRAGLKGAYRTQDLERVETAAACLSRRVGAALETRTSWGEPPPDEAFAAELERYLANVRRLAGRYRQLCAGTPDPHGVLLPEPALPETMERLNWSGANAIETQLDLLELLLDWRETVEFYEQTRSRTWRQFEAAYPVWDGPEGQTWIEVQLGPGVLAGLPVPWEKGAGP